MTRPANIMMRATSWRAVELEAREALRARLGLELIRGAVRLYHTRCREVARWWSTPEAAGFRRTLRAGLPQPPGDGRAAALASRGASRARSPDAWDEERGASRSVDRAQRRGCAGRSTRRRRQPDRLGVFLSEEMVQAQLDVLNNVDGGALAWY